MNKQFFYKQGGYLVKKVETDKSGLVPFPVCLAIQEEEKLSAECPDFILNIGDSWVFVKTDTPLPAGTPVLLHFYIPPEIKLLAEIRGTVSNREERDPADPPGMLIKFRNTPRETVERLEGYIEGGRHLIDIKL